MAKKIVSKNLHGLNFSHKEIDAFRSMVLIGYRMAKLLSNDKIKKLSIKTEAESLISDWNSTASELITVMLGF